MTGMSARLGHAAPSFTLDVYGWVLPANLLIRSNRLRRLGPEGG
jgi:hypothetical protein